jgi:hypothetical protein
MAAKNKTPWLAIIGAVLLLGAALLLWQSDRLIAMFGPKAPASTPYDFTLNVKMSDYVEQRLKATGDNIAVTVYYYGLAKPDAKTKPDDLGRIDLGYQEGMFGGNQRAFKIVNHGLDTGKLSEVQVGTVYVLISIYTTQQDNLPDGMVENQIDCDGYTGQLSDLQKFKVTVNCDKHKP